MTEIDDRLQRAIGSAYTLERELSGGAMSRVFVATENSLGRRVVVKILTSDFSGDLRAERFRREIALAARLHHPHIVPLYNAGQAEALLYYTMPFVEGESLRELLWRERQLPIRMAVRIARDVAGALEYAHLQGVAHRDIKPDNILMDGGHACVTDFGIARALEVVGGEKLTGTGLTIGTPGYMSPEQASGEIEVGPRSDVYSLGCVLYEMLAGEPPFTGSNAAAIIAKRFAGPPPRVAILRDTVSPALEEVVARSLARAPADRYQSASELVHALEEILEKGIGTGSGIRAVAASTADNPPLAGAPQGTLSYAATLLSRRWLRRSGIAAAVLLPLAGIGIVTARGRASTPAYVEHRVVVAPFENETGDSTLTPFGAMAADWISQAIARTRRVDVVDARTAQLTTRIVTSSPDLIGTGGPAMALARETRAGLLVTGSYYKDGDSLRVLTRLTNAATGELLFALDPASGHVAHSSALLEQLRARVVGAVATVVDTSLGRLTQNFGLPPSYEAYQEMYRALEAFYRRDFPAAFAGLHEAAALDTSFIAPRIMLSVTIAEAGGYRPPAWQTSDSIVRSLTGRRDRMTVIERAILERLRATLDGDKDAILRASRALVEQSPASAEWVVTHASAALHDGRPKEALAALETSDPRRGFNRVSEYYWGLKSSAYHQLGRFADELQASSDGLAQFPEREMVVTFQVQALAAMGRTDDLKAALNQRVRLTSDAHRTAMQRRLRLMAIRELRAHDHAADAGPLLASTLALAQRGVASDTTTELRTLYGELLYLAGRYREAQAIFAGLAARDPMNAELLGSLGAAAQRAGDAGTRAAIEARLALAKAPWMYGEPSYGRARLAALRSRPAEAIDLLEAASREGHSLHFSYVRRSRDAHADEDFASLAEERRFADLLMPR